MPIAISRRRASALRAMKPIARFAGWAPGMRAAAICPGAIDPARKAGSPTPATVAGIVTFARSLPNQASVPDRLANTWPESTP